MVMFHLYGLMIGVAIVVGWSITERIEPKINAGAPWIISFGIIGARIYHVVNYWEYYGHNWGQIVMLWRGGLSIWGALIAGVLVTCIYFKGGTFKVLGACVTALPVAQAIGRVGNGVNHEFTNLVFGIPWWGAEAILDLVLFVLIFRLRGSSLKVLTYLLGYGLIRLVLQPYRL